MRWYLAHDRGPLPHLFRVLWLFWTQQDLEREAWPWAEQLLPGFGTLDPQARAELAWAAAVLAGDVGDDADALATRQRLAPLLPGISDPFLHAVAQLAMAWTLPVADDYEGALREAAASLEELRGQDEPVFTGMAALHRRLPGGGARAATMTPCDTCVRRVTWLSEPGATGSPRAPGCSWASWLSCGAASMRPGRCWRRR